MPDLEPGIELAAFVPIAGARKSGAGVGQPVVGGTRELLFGVRIEDPVAHGLAEARADELGIEGERRRCGIGDGAGFSAGLDDVAGRFARFIDAKPPQCGGARAPFEVVE